jgi:Glycosyl transferase family 2
MGLGVIMQIDFEMQSQSEALISYLGTSARRSRLIAVGEPLPASLRSQFRYQHLTTHGQDSSDRGRIDISSLSDADLNGLAGADCIVVCMDVSTLAKTIGRRLSKAIKRWFRNNALIVHISGDRQDLRFSTDALDDFGRQFALPALHVGLLCPTDEQSCRAVAIYDREVQDALNSSSPALPLPIAIISTFNESDVIEQVVQDTIDQGCELIVLDNWSTDGTWEILRAMQSALSRQLELQRFPAEPATQSSWAKILARKEEIASQFPAAGFYTQMPMS